MAAITSVAIAGVSAGYAIYNGEKQKKEGKKALNDFERQELSNAYENMPISTLGSDIIREEAGRTTATLTQAARESGSSGVFSAIPKIQAQNNQQSLQAARLIDDQVINRNRLIAGDNTRIQSMQENRDNADLQGIGQMIEVGRQQTQDGIDGLSNTLMSAAANWPKNETPRQKKAKIDKRIPQGLKNYGPIKPDLSGLKVAGYETPMDYMNAPSYAIDYSKYEPKPYI